MVAEGRTELVIVSKKEGKCYDYGSIDCWLAYCGGVTQVCHVVSGATATCGTSDASSCALRRVVLPSRRLILHRCLLICNVGVVLAKQLQNCCIAIALAIFVAIECLFESHQFLA
jgi:hypothetical protein